MGSHHISLSIICKVPIIFKLEVFYRSWEDHQFFIIIIFEAYFNRDELGWIFIYINKSLLEILNTHNYIKHPIVFYLKVMYSWFYFRYLMYQSEVEISKWFYLLIRRIKKKNSTLSSPFLTILEINIRQGEKIIKEGNFMN